VTGIQINRNNMASTADYWVGATIGTGRFGTVVHCRHKGSGLDVAIKCIAKNDMKDRLQAMAVLQEQKILKMFRRREEATAAAPPSYVVALYASFHDPECVYLVLECCSGGTLQDVVAALHFPGLSQHGSLPHPGSGAASVAAVVNCYGQQLLEGISHLHAGAIAHCDVKPANCLLTASGRLKLADFGCALDLRKPTANALVAVPRGTTTFSAPELIHGKCNSELSNAVDLWSFGCVVAALWTGTTPFEAESDALTVQRIQDYCQKSQQERGKFLSSVVNDKINASWKHFLGALLHPEPLERLGAKDFDGSKVMLDVSTAHTVYPSVRSHAVWEEMSESNTPLYLPPVPSWWEKASKIQAPAEASSMKDGKDGWSAFLV
jgi:serine/threonine protein kinase